MVAKFQKFTTHLCYNNQAEEAVALYTSLLEKYDIEELKRIYEGGPTITA